MYRGVDVYIHVCWPGQYLELSDQLYAPAALSLEKKLLYPLYRSWS
jgi:hypothetical protein